MGRSALSKMTFLALRRPRETTWLPPQRFEKRLLPLGGAAEEAGFRAESRKFSLTVGSPSVLHP